MPLGGGEMTRDKAMMLLFLATAAVAVLLHQVSEGAMAQDRTASTARLARVH
jgi:hypothetical protein